MRHTLSLLGILIVSIIAAAPAFGARAGFGLLFYDGMVVRTIVPPAAMTQEGLDDFYVVVGGAEGQLGVAAVAPGDRDYHGGKWAFHLVVWEMSVQPYLLDSEEKVFEAEDAGHVTIMRMPEKDFKCPIQP